MIERENKYTLKAKNIWRENKRTITLMGVAIVVGILLIAFNFLSYQNTTNKFSTNQRQNISQANPTTDINFDLNQPELITESSMEVEFDNIEVSTVEVILNGRQISTVSSQTALVNLPSDQLRSKNTVTFRRANPAFGQQALVSADVDARTSLQQIVFVGLNLFSLILIFVPLGTKKYREVARKKQMEEEFPGFLRDVVEATRAGMSLPQAVKNTEEGSYGPLDSLIEQMSAQIEWGVPFDEVLTEFADKTDSNMIQRSVDTIIQAYNSGGNIQEVLESVGDNIRSIKQLKEERQSQLYGEMITGYIVYFIFIGILIALTTYLLPNLASASEQLGQSSGSSLGILGGGTGSGDLQQNISSYRSWFARLVYIQAVFSGLIIGKLSEGQMSAGLKHVAILFAIGYLSTTFAFG